LTEKLCLTGAYATSTVAVVRAFDEYRNVRESFRFDRSARNFWFGFSSIVRAALSPHRALAGERRLRRAMTRRLLAAPIEGLGDAGNALDSQRRALSVLARFED
jgi:hypothetical protein